MCIRGELANCKGTVMYYERLMAKEYILEGYNIKETFESVTLSYYAVHGLKFVKKWIDLFKTCFSGLRLSNLTFWAIGWIESICNEYKGIAQTGVLNHV